MQRIDHGFADYYYLLEDGRIYNEKTDQIIMEDNKHLFLLRTQEQQRKKVALKTLYQLVYHKPYSKDEIENL